MELIEGPTLAERIARGPIPLEEALGIARQIAAALDAAHEKGIVHRDLKPANVKIKPDGVVKVLDFGLAKVVDASTAGTSEASPTISLAATQTGVILGTAAYMSPEQARGKPVDKRADIWAFGLIVYEMLTGSPMFGGDTISDVLAAVLRAEINLTQLPPETPGSVRRLIERCLRRNPKDRLRDIGDARLEMDSSNDRVVPPVATTPLTRLLPWAVAALLSAALLWTLLRAHAPTPAQPVTRWVVRKNPRSGLWSLSHDGSQMAYYEDPGLMVRRLDQPEAIRLTGTEGGWIRCSRRTVNGSCITRSQTSRSGRFRPLVDRR